MCHICDKTKIFYEKLKRHQKYKLRGYNYFKRGGKMKILVVDDNKNINDVLIKYCKREGYETIAAYDGEESVDIYEKEKLDLILLDVMLPKLDGFEVCKIIREKSNIPIIMITAKSEDMDRIMGLDIGADDYIIKPFSPAEVMARIRAILSRLQNSEFKIDFEEINILDVVSDAIRTIRQIAKSKDIEVVLKVDNENSAIYVNGDYMRLRQLIIILGDNAIKFSENGEKVEISVEKVDKKIRISVKDYGCGIDGKYKEDIFERFSKSKDESNKVGTGLGLAIAQNIAMRHESLIVVESKVGKGSNFYFDIETTTIER